MKAGVNVYGGFKAYGNPGKREGERDISNLKSEYQTILDGDSKSQVVNGSGITTSTLWEGLTIQNGYVDGGKGGGIYMDGSGITLKNCLVKNNYLIAYDAWNDKIANDYSQGGAGVYMSGNCTLKDCIVRNNIIKSGKKSGAWLRKKCWFWCLYEGWYSHQFYDCRELLRLDSPWISNFGIGIVCRVFIYCQ